MDNDAAASSAVTCPIRDAKGDQSVRKRGTMACRSFPLLCFGGDE
jgi:hypothetical protein